MPRPTTAPLGPDDPIAPLSGTKDISVPAYSVVPYLVTNTDWLLAGNGYPSDLRLGWLGLPSM